MSILALLMGLVLTTAILWAVNTYVPYPLRLVLSLVVIIVFVVALLSVFGLLGPFSQPIGRLWGESGDYRYIRRATSGRARTYLTSSTCSTVAPSSS